ncbi:haloacid dehalogenase [Nitratifractor sp.]|uniref:HAD family hydrolase n=1 Tax=Nitratifractor sp. TaxID=2268144 RepID=UPI0025D5F5AB|nr:haloacid dehalogenase [Nitratifractor sp.]
MLTIEIPGFGTLKLDHLVLDYNGTLARDGRLDPDAARLLPKLARDFRLHVVTADTFGTVEAELSGLPVELRILRSGDHTAEKAAFVHELGAQNCVAVGNGNNDRAMLESAALGIVILGEEGAAIETLQTADIVVPSIGRALELLLKPKRLVATLRR